MDNFDYKSYLRSGKIHGDKSMLTESEQVSEKKKQGDDDREDESLGARKGAEKGKKVSMKGRRDDSYGKFGKRDAEAKGKAKGPGKNKINKESQEVDESLAVAAGVASIFGGAAALNKIMDKLEKGDLGEKGKSIAKSLASLGSAASSVRKESQEVDESLAVAAGVASIFGGAAALNKIMDKLEKGDLGEKGKSIAKSLASLGSAASSVRKEGYSPNYEEDDIDPMSENARTGAEQEGYKDGFNDAKDDIEGALKKMKVSELKAKIRENILSTLNEAEVEEMSKPKTGEKEAEELKEEEVDEALDMTASPETLRKMIFQLLDDGRIQPETADDLLNAISNSPSKNIYEKEEVDVDIDVEDEVEVDAEADDIEIERKGVKAKVEVGLSPEEEIVQDSLKAAMDAAEALGSDKLADQIGNTITFFTRQFVVGDSTD